MDLENFRYELINRIRMNALASASNDKEEFLNYMSMLFQEAEIIDEDIEYMPFEGLGAGRGKKKIQIEGYSFNELDEALSIYVIPEFDYSKMVVMTSAFVEKYLSRAKAFIEDSEYIVKTAEESAPAYGLAYDIVNRYVNIRKYRIYLLTEKITGRNLNSLEASIHKGIDFEYHIWDIERIKQLEESKNGKEDIEIDLKQFVDEGLPCLIASKTESYTSYLCNIPGILLANLYNMYNGRLLEGNVRSFLQTKGKVNKGIRNTILNDPDMFFAYNNGIAATASEIEVKNINNATFIEKIRNLQIVNGGQTTASLAMALIKDKKDNSEEKIKRIFVPMKLSVLKDTDTAQVLIPNISRYANSQNKVSEADLWSNHPFHIRMEEFSRRIIAPAINGQQYGTYWYYERANGQYKQETYKESDSKRKMFERINPKQQMFNKIQLAKYINILRGQPHIASAGGQKSFSKFAEWASSKWESNDKLFNENFYRKTIALAIIFQSTDKIVKSQIWYNSYKANIVAYSMSLLFYKVQKEHSDRAIDFKTIWNRQMISDAWNKQMAKLSKIVYEFLIDEERQVENVTEWAKREACWKMAKELKIILDDEFVKELMYREDFERAEKDSIKDQKENNTVNIMTAVAEFGENNWCYLIEWNRSHNVLDDRDLSFIKTATQMNIGKFPSEKQCFEIMRILEKARNEGFPK